MEYLLREWHYWMQKVDEGLSFLVIGNFIFQKCCKRELWTTSTSEQHFLWHDFIHHSSQYSGNLIQFYKIQNASQDIGCSVVIMHFTSSMVYFSSCSIQTYDTAITQWWQYYVTNTISLHVLGRVGREIFVKWIRHSKNKNNDGSTELCKKVLKKIVLIQLKSVNPQLILFISNFGYGFHFQFLLYHWKYIILNDPAWLPSACISYI